MGELEEMGQLGMVRFLTGLAVEAGDAFGVPPEMRRSPDLVG